MSQHLSLSELLTVVVPTCGRPEPLRECLVSLRNGVKLPDRVVVVENGFRGGAEAIVREVSGKILPKVDYLYVPQANKSNALNQALAMMEGGLLVMLDDDVICEPGFLDAYAESRTPGCFFGGPVKPRYDSQEPLPNIQPYLPRSVVGFDREFEPYMGQTAFFIGSNWSAFVEDLRAAGGFDPNFGPGSNPRASGQESNMQKRLVKFGLTPKFLHGAIVVHRIPKSNVTAGFALRRRFYLGLHDGLVARNAELPEELSIVRRQISLFRTVTAVIRRRKPAFHVLWELAYRFGHLRGRLSRATLVSASQKISSSVLRSTEG